MFRLHRGYALAALALFSIELVIALFVRDRFVRPYLGDVLAVVFVYSTVKGAVRIGMGAAVAMALAIAFAVEIGQWLGILDMLGWQEREIARIVLGTGFDIADLLAYTAGAALVLMVEGLRIRRCRGLSPSPPVAKPPSTGYAPAFPRFKELSG